MRKSSKVLITILIVFSLFINQKTTYAATYYINAGGFASAKNLTYTNVALSDYSIASSAINQWLNVSSNVKITEQSNLVITPPANILLNCNVITSPNVGGLGVAFYYNNGTLVSITSIRTQAVLTQYKDTTLLDTANKQKATAVHEIGHALSLADFTNASDTRSSIMRQGVKTSYTLYSYDKEALRNKWGN